MVKHFLKISFIVVGSGLLLLVLVGGFIAIRPDTYIPHKRIVLHVPYEFSDPPSNLIPMGETIFHPKPRAPQGHPGIDFQWNHVTNIIASADGTISSITQTPDHFNNWDIEVSSWPYAVRYKELEDYDSTLKVGSSIKTGQFLGHPMHGHPNAAIQIHWEFASTSSLRDRFCPITYFDDASRQSIESIWVKSTWQYKSQFPDICSGDYKNAVE